VIDLGYSKERMLGDIGASPEAPLVCDLSDPEARARFVSLDQVRLLVRAHAPEEILPSLDALLSARFSEVAPERLRRDLLAPIKKAVGNAHKRGNQRDPEKWITLGVVVTPAGVCVDVSDEGAGFEVAETWARMRAGTPYFSHGGSGFRKYEKAKAVISFARGGSTFLARFLTPRG
jgi:hypothetical protein